MSILARLIVICLWMSMDMEFRRNNLRFNASTYFRRGVQVVSRLANSNIQKERKDVDHETVH